MVEEPMSLKVSRILHAGYIFECEGFQIAFDPLFENPFSRNCFAFPPVQFKLDQIRKLKFSAVFISHYHDDHCSLESLNLLDRATPLYIFCIHEELFEMIRALGFTHVYSLRLDKMIEVGPFKITPRTALDADVDSLFHIQIQGLNILNVVDSWIGPETFARLQEHVPWDLVLWPFQTMRELEVIAPTRFPSAPPEIPIEWLEQLQLLKPNIVVPSSCQFKMEPWSWYNKKFFPISYEFFENTIRSILPATKVLRIDPSQSYEINKSGETVAAASLNWITPLSSADLDYDYEANFVPPATAQIARNFPALEQSQLQRVIDYCNVELLEKYRSLETPVDSYFGKRRLWKLSLFDHLGAENAFYYSIDQSTIAKIAEPEPQETLAWTTEIPLARLYGALEKGESLTSLYLRINSETFSPETEDELSDADILEDPLLQCLYSGVFGSYQRAQLKQIQNSSL